jgi:hypothetical protein
MADLEKILVVHKFSATHNPMKFLGSPVGFSVGSVGDVTWVNRRKYRAFMVKMLDDLVTWHGWKDIGKGIASEEGAAYVGGKELGGAIAKGGGDIPWTAWASDCSCWEIAVKYEGGIGDGGSILVEGGHNGGASETMDGSSCGETSRTKVTPLSSIRVGLGVAVEKEASVLEG